MNGSVPENQGRLFRQQIVGPGAGAVVAVYPSVGLRWLVYSIVVVFITDATVSNRQVYWRYGYTGAFGAAMWSNIVQTASLTRTYHFHSGLSCAPYSTLSHIQMALSPRYVMNPLFGLEIGADNLQAGDEFTGIHVYGEEWIDDL